MEGQDPWAELSAGNSPGDRRFVMSMGPFDLEPGEEVCVKFATVIGEQSIGTTAIEALYENTDFVIEQYENCYGGILESLEDIEGTISVNEIERGGDFIQYNNETQLLNITPANSAKNKVSIHNSIGQIVFSSSFTNQFSEVVSLPSEGIYIISTQNENGLKSAKRIIAGE